MNVSVVCACVQLTDDDWEYENIVLERVCLTHFIRVVANSCCQQIYSIILYMIHYCLAVMLIKG